MSWRMINPDLVQISPNNSGAMPPGVSCVVIHATRSGVSMNPTEFEGTLNYMSTPGTTSSHWVISREGVKARVVYDDLMAWHAGQLNDNAWGIELEQGVESDGFTQAQMDALVQVCKGYMEDYGVPAHHSHVFAFPGFVGHEETAQGMEWGKTDPGSLFDWDWFIAALGGEEEPAMIIKNVSSPWFDEPENQVIPPNETRGCNAREDFGLDASAKSIEVEVYLQMGSPSIRVCHGGPDSEHAFIIPITGAYFKGRVWLDDTGWFQLQAFDGEARIKEVHMCGYYNV